MAEICSFALRFSSLFNKIGGKVLDIISLFEIQDSTKATKICPFGVKL